MKAITKQTGILKKMREIRDELSLKIMDMDFEQQKNYMTSKLAELKEKRKQNITVL